MVMERFIRTERLLGKKYFAALQSKSVTLVGIGAVGGYVLEGLVRGGVKNIRIVDFDTIQPSNINRQLLALETTIGEAKIEVARKRAREINSDCRIKTLPLFAREDTIAEILSPTPDLLIDAIDSLNPKTQLLYEAYHKQIPIISSMGAALRTDPSKITTGDLFSTKNCPLARHLRRRLRRRGITRGINCVYSTETLNYEFNPTDMEPDSSETQDQDNTGKGRLRNTLGSLPTITGIFGLTIANMAIMQLSGFQTNQQPGQATSDRK